MVEATVLFLGLTLATIFFLLCVYVLKTFGLIEDITKAVKAELTTTEKLERVLLIINSAVASGFVGMLGSITLVQFAIAGNTHANYIIDHINNPSLMMASYVFNLATSASVASLLVLVFIIYLANRYRMIKATELDDEPLEQKKVSIVDLDKVKAKEDQEDSKNDESRDKSLALPKAKEDKPKALTGNGLTGNEALLGALMSPRRSDNQSKDDKADDKPKTRADYRKKTEAKEDSDKDEKDTEDKEAKED
ncbi:hypothetical protein AAA435_11810 [Lactobacillus crispatus]|uniref:hypothetical protein n=1 Tax=Lactobacillus crispatus TaxID=47770 RepID=UPI0030F8E647